MGLLRAFLYAPSRRSHAGEVARLQALLPNLPTPEVVESAYRRSAGRLNALFFAQGVVVGALGNLFASAVGHFIDRPAGLQAWAWQDDAWVAIGVLSILVMATMAAGAFQRLRQDHRVEAMFLAELTRRGGTATDDGGDPEDLVASGPRRPPHK